MFIDSSKPHLKVMFLYNECILRSIPLDNIVHMKETNDKMKQLLRYISYDKHHLQPSDDLEIVVLLMCLQLESTKYFVIEIVMQKIPNMSRETGDFL